jgi:hypothetical protein
MVTNGTRWTRRLRKRRSAISGWNCYFQDRETASVIVLFGIHRVVVESGAMLVYAVRFDDVLALV